MLIIYIFTYTFIQQIKKKNVQKRAAKYKIQNCSTQEQQGYHKS